MTFSQTCRASLPTKTTNPAEIARPRLLVVDEDAVHRMVIAKVAAKAGYEVFEAASFEEATIRIHERRYDCITLDLSLAGGVKVLRDLGTSKCKAPIIIISGSGEPVNVETIKIGKSLDLNIGPPIRKPVNLAVLRQSLFDVKSQIPRPVSNDYLSASQKA